MFRTPSNTIHDGSSPATRTRPLATETDLRRQFNRIDIGASPARRLKPSTRPSGVRQTAVPSSVPGRLRGASRFSIGSTVQPPRYSLGGGEGLPSTDEEEEAKTPAQQAQQQSGPSRSAQPTATTTPTASAISTDNFVKTLRTLFPAPDRSSQPTDALSLFSALNSFVQTLPTDPCYMMTNITRQEFVNTHTRLQHLPDHIVLYAAVLTSPATLLPDRDHIVTATHPTPDFGFVVPKHQYGQCRVLVLQILKQFVGTIFSTAILHQRELTSAWSTLLLRISVADGLAQKTVEDLWASLRLDGRHVDTLVARAHLVKQYAECLLLTPLDDKHLLARIRYSLRLSRYPGADNFFAFNTLGDLVQHLLRNAHPQHNTREPRSYTGGWCRLHNTSSHNDSECRQQLSQRAGRPNPTTERRQPAATPDRGLDSPCHLHPHGSHTNRQCRRQNGSAFNAQANRPTSAGQRRTQPQRGSPCPTCSKYHNGGPCRKENSTAQKRVWKAYNALLAEHVGSPAHTQWQPHPDVMNTMASQAELQPSQQPHRRPPVRLNGLLASAQTAAHNEAIAAQSANLAAHNARQNHYSLDPVGFPDM